MKFRSTLQYSACSEDTESEISALSISPSDDVVAIAGGGGRALGLLTERCQQVIAVDFNYHQVAITKLKVAAIKVCDHREFLAFLGVTPEAAVSRGPLIDRVMSELDSETREYWVGRHKELLLGIIYRGELERRLAIGARLMAKLLGRNFAEFVDAPDLCAQNSALLRLRKMWRFRALMRLGTDPLLFRLLHDNWGFYRGRDPRMNVSAHIVACLISSLEKRSLKDSPFLQLIFAGKYLEGASLPRYLRPESYNLIKGHIAKMAVVHQDILSFLDNASMTKPTKVSISNVPAFLSGSERQRLWDALSCRLVRGSIVCARLFLGEQVPSDKILANFERMHSLEQRLNSADRSAIYRFLILLKV